MYPITTLTPSSFASSRLRTAQPAVERLYIRGDVARLNTTQPMLAVVGSRKATAYGRMATTELVHEVAKRNVAIVSGLALGVDSLAHQAALDVGGYTIAVLPCGIDTIYPATHRMLGRRILEKGGTLVSEYTGTELPRKDQFIARNRIIAALADAVLITEAASRSGSLHTAEFALEQGKTVLAVPGGIYSPLSSGTNQLIKSGALPVTNADDIFMALKMADTVESQELPMGANKEEHAIIQLIGTGIQDGEALLAASGLEATVFHHTLTMLEITGTIKSLGGNQWGL